MGYVGIDWGMRGVLYVGIVGGLNTGLVATLKHVILTGFVLDAGNGFHPGVKLPTLLRTWTCKGSC